VAGAVIGTVMAGLAGSTVGAGLGSLLAALVWFAWIAMLAVRILRPTRAEGVGEPTSTRVRSLRPSRRATTAPTACRRAAAWLRFWNLFPAARKLGHGGPEWRKTH